MTSTGFPTLTTRTSYWQVSRAPRYSLLFAIPLLVFYQVLALLLAHGERSIRNGADVILQALFTAAAGAWGPPLFMVRSEEHTSELQSLRHLVCRLLLEKKKNKNKLQDS